MALHPELSCASSRQQHMEGRPPRSPKEVLEAGEVQGVYWMWPFQNHQTFCPYLVGSYEEVSEEMSHYMRRGFESFILDIPSSREELRHIETVFERAPRAGTRP